MKKSEAWLFLRVGLLAHAPAPQLVDRPLHGVPAVLPGLVAGNDLIGKSVVDHGSNVSRVRNGAVSSH